MVNLYRFVLLAGLIAVLAACGASAPLPRESFYRLVVPRDIHPVPSPPLAGTLLVKRFGADGVIAQRPVAFARAADPRTLHQYHYHFWADVPPRLLRDYAVDFLRRSHLAERVVTAELGLEADYLLRGKIRRLEFLQGAAPAVAVSLELSLVRSTDQRLLINQTYSMQRPVAGQELARAGAAVNTVLAEIFKRFTRDLSTRGSAS